MEFLGQRGKMDFFRKQRPFSASARKVSKLKLFSQKNMEFWNFYIYILNYYNNNIVKTKT